MSWTDDWARSLRDPQSPKPSGLVTWNGSDPGQRFGVYRNNVMASLIAALADTFPVVEQLVGPEFFRVMASRFVQAQPPQSPVLARYGDAFPAFVAEFAPAASLPYLPDLARLELAYLAAFHAADAEPLNPAVWQALLADPDALPARRFRFQPALQVIRSDHAIVSLWAAHQADASRTPEEVNPGTPEIAWVMRPGWQVGIQAATAADTAFLAAMMAGQTLGRALTLTEAEFPGFSPTACLGLWLAEGLVVGIAPG